MDSCIVYTVLIYKYIHVHVFICVWLKDTYYTGGRIVVVSSRLPRRKATTFAILFLSLFLVLIIFLSRTIEFYRSSEYFCCLIRVIIRCLLIFRKQATLSLIRISFNSDNYSCKGKIDSISILDDWGVAGTSFSIVIGKTLLCFINYMKVRRLSGN